MTDPLLHSYTPQPGELLYHYTSAAGALGILRSKALWLSDYRRMNDPREFLHAKNGFLAALRDRAVYVEQSVRYVAVATVTSLETQMLMLIGCLTRQSDAPYQWAHYADDGGGCVLGIDADYLANEAGVATRTVNYDPTYLQQFVHAGLRVLQREFEDKANDLSSVSCLAKWLATDLFAFKEPAFSHEQEIRISRLIHRDASVHGFSDRGGHGRGNIAIPPLPLLVRQGLSGECRYIELPLTLNRSQGIRSIGFGARCPPTIKRQVADAARSFGPRVLFWDSTVDVLPHK